VWLSTLSPVWIHPLLSRRADRGGLHDGLGDGDDGDDDDAVTRAGDRPPHDGERPGRGSHRVPSEPAASDPSASSTDIRLRTHTVNAAAPRPSTTRSTMVSVT
jgi:hypothetical protein